MPYLLSCNTKSFNISCCSLDSNLQVISHSFGENIIQQRVKDGFINGTAMCVAHNKMIADWLDNKDTFELFLVLMNELNSNNPNSLNSYKSTLSATKYAKMFPELIVVKQERNNGINNRATNRSIFYGNSSKQLK